MVETKCMAAYLNKLLKFTKTGSPYLDTATGKRYSCKKELEKKGKTMNNYKNTLNNNKNTKIIQKPTNRPSQFIKGTVRNGYIVTMVKVPGGSGKRKAWRKIK